MSPSHAIPTGAAGVVRWVGEAESTNTDVLGMARRGAPEGTVVVADHQTAGRGRLGRSWVAPAGSSLLFSVLVRPKLDPDELHLVTTAMGVAVVDACTPVLAGAAQPLLKWPNDVVVETGPAPGKVAGVLAESLVEGARVTAVVVGVGLNVNWPPAMPPELVGIATALNHVRGGSLVDRPRLLGEVLEGFWRRYREQITGDRSALLGDARRCSATLDRVVRAEIGEEVVEGVAVDIDLAGHLIVDTGAGRRAIVAGDVARVRPVA